MEKSSDEIMKEMIKEKKITGHCNICGSDIIFEWSEPKDFEFIYKMIGLMENHIKDTNRCACSLMKIIKTEAE